MSASEFPPSPEKDCTPPVVQASAGRQEGGKQTDTIARLIAAASLVVSTIGLSINYFTYASGPVLRANAAIAQYEATNESRQYIAAKTNAGRTYSAQAIKDDPLLTHHVTRLMNNLDTIAVQGKSGHLDETTILDSLYCVFAKFQKAF